MVTDFYSFSFYPELAPNYTEPLQLNSIEIYGQVAKGDAPRRERCQEMINQ